MILFYIGFILLRAGQLGCYSFLLFISFFFPFFFFKLQRKVKRLGTVIEKETKKQEANLHNFFCKQLVFK